MDSGTLGHATGHDIGRNTIKRILAEHGIVPAPERGRRTPWSTFLKAHWEALAATDFFTIEILTLDGLRRYFVLFVMELRSRRVEIAGISPQPFGGGLHGSHLRRFEGATLKLRQSSHLVAELRALDCRSARAEHRTVRVPKRECSRGLLGRSWCGHVREDVVWSAPVHASGPLRGGGPRYRRRSSR